MHLIPTFVFVLAVALLVYLVVGDLDAVIAEFGRPADEPPYGCDIELCDPDGNRLRISTARG